MLLEIRLPQTTSYGIAVATGDGISLDSNGAIQSNESVVTAGHNIAVSPAMTGASPLIPSAA